MSRKGTSEKRKELEREIFEPYEPNDDEINELFGFSDESSEDGNENHFKRIRQINQKNVKEYLWKAHSLIITDMAAKKDDLKHADVVVGINPKKSEFENASLNLEATRRNAIVAFNNLKGKNKCRCYLQFDLTSKATDKGDEVDDDDLSDDSSLNTLDCGLKAVSSKIDCIEIAWGENAQTILDKSVDIKQRLKKILKPYMKKGLLYQFTGSKKFPYHFSAPGSNKLEKLTENDFENYLGQ
ncbi:hypothetical protein [Ligilactobacillus aviarius]|uniref:hypothetical protein n=1 Tax=Ligilactobacillus aviarius TaxID=1606 RepID=UPI00117A741B|nr:hypothetical protein [Ligilactobacillus aviarius]